MSSRIRKYLQSASSSWTERTIFLPFSYTVQTQLKKNCVRRLLSRAAAFSILLFFSAYRNWDWQWVPHRGHTQKHVTERFISVFCFQNKKKKVYIKERGHFWHINANIVNVIIIMIYSSRNAMILLSSTSQDACARLKNPQTPLNPTRMRVKSILHKNQSPLWTKTKHFSPENTPKPT